MTVTHDGVAAFLHEHVVDTTEAARMLGLARRQSLAYHVGRRIQPVGRFGGSDVFWRDDVTALAERLNTWHHRGSDNGGGAT